MKIQIKSRYTNVIMHKYEEESLKIAVVKSVKSGADLRGAYLRGQTFAGQNSIQRAMMYSASWSGFRNRQRSQRKNGSSSPTSAFTAFAGIASQESSAMQQCAYSRSWQRLVIMNT